MIADDTNPGTVDSGLTKLDVIIEMAQLLGEQSDYDEMLRLVVEKASRLIHADAALVMMINPRTRNTVKTVYAEQQVNDEHAHLVHTNISGWVILSNKSFLSEDIKSDTRFRKRLFEKVQAKSAICVPFRVGTSIIGTLLLLNGENSRQFAADDLAITEKLSAIASPFLHSAEAIGQYFTPTLPRHTLVQKYASLGLYGKSAKFMELLHSIEAASRSDVRILLEGESGTGKELVARAVHKLSGRSHNKFVAIDCGAIQPNLVESELFGHAKGAFTGASTNRRGLFEEAHEGTMFMDEVNNLPVDMQSKLLRVLQDEEIRPVGSNEYRKVNVRVIAASSQMLRPLVMEGKFREDLYYRLNVYPIHVPSLDERAEDIPILAEYFLEKSRLAQEKKVDGFHAEVLDFLKHRHWPGNIRELENCVERLVTLAGRSKTVIDWVVLPPELQKELKKKERTHDDVGFAKSLNDTLAECEEECVRKALDHSDWNQSRAARMLRISEHTLRYKMEKLHIVRPN